MMITMKEMETQFYKTQKVMVVATQELQKFHKMTEEHYGYDYAEKDNDEVIDTIDYGGGGWTFKQFEKAMNNKWVKDKGGK